MLHRQHRLRQPATIQAVRRDGRCLRDPLVILCYLPNDAGVARFCFSASRRLGNAVTRNRIKRVLRSTVHHRLDRIAPGWDCVLIARAAAAEAPYAQVDAAMEKLLRRAGLISQNKT